MAETVNAVIIAYPRGGDEVPGGGGFYSWGYVEGDLQPETASGELSPSEGTIATDPNGGPSPCTWGIKIGDLTPNHTYTLTVTADDMMGNSASKSVTFKVVSYR
jgi:hypothetical protein